MTVSPSSIQMTIESKTFTQKRMIYDIHDSFEMQIKNMNFLNISLDIYNTFISYVAWRITEEFFAEENAGKHFWENESEKLIRNGSILMQN